MKVIIDRFSRFFHPNLIIINSLKRQVSERPALLPIATEIYNKLIFLISIRITSKEIIYSIKIKRPGSGALSLPGYCALPL